MKAYRLHFVVQWDLFHNFNLQIDMFEVGFQCRIVVFNRLKLNIRISGAPIVFIDFNLNVILLHFDICRIWMEKPNVQMKFAKM